MRSTMKSHVTQPEGNYYDKYGSNNLIVKWIMRGFFRSFDKLLDSVVICGTGRILEVGCGEGEIISYVQHKLGCQMSYFASDISQIILEKAANQHSGILFYKQDIYSPITEKYDLIICSEVIEHIDDPHRALIALAEASDSFIFSVPNEPIWRILNVIRGKYLKDLGNTPGHVNHFSKKSFNQLLNNCGFECVEWKKPLPWIMVRCQRKNKEK